MATYFIDDHFCYLYTQGNDFSSRMSDLYYKYLKPLDMDQYTFRSLSQSKPP